MNSTDLLVDAIRDHVEAVAPATLATCSFVIRDQADDRTFPQVRVSERSIEEHEVIRGSYRARVDATLRTNPEDTSDATHYAMVEELWGLVADEDIERSLSSMNYLKCHDCRCSGPITEPEDGYRSTVLELNVVFARQ